MRGDEIRDERRRDGDRQSRKTLYNLIADDESYLTQNNLTAKLSNGGQVLNPKSSTRSAVQ